MKIGVIGATGMIGHHTAKAVMEAGYELTVIHRESSRLDRIEDLSYAGRMADLDDPDSLQLAFKDLDAVIHCAGYYPVLPKPLLQEVEKASRQMNAFLDACQANAIGKILYVGAAISLPPASDGNPATETAYYEQSPPDKTPYTQVKWAMDKIARERADQEGIPVVIGIPAMTFGEYDYQPTTGRLLREVARQNLKAYVNGKRSIVYAGDLGKGLLQACLHGKAGERYLFSSENVTIEELVNMAAKAANVEGPKRILSLKKAKILSKLLLLKYRLFKGEPPVLNSTTIAVLSAGQYLDSSRSIRELGFKPNLNSRAMIEKTINWFKAEGMLDQPPK